MTNDDEVKNWNLTSFLLAVIHIAQVCKKSTEKKGNNTQTVGCSLKKTSALYGIFRDRGEKKYWSE